MVLNFYEFKDQNSSVAGILILKTEKLAQNTNHE